MSREPQMGDRFGPLKLRAITRTTLALFAGASGDHNPIHIDLDVARATGRDDVIVHGMLVMAYVGRLLTDSFSQSQLRSLAVRFLAVVPVHAVLECSAEVVAVGSSETERHAHLTIAVTREERRIVARGEAVVAVGDARLGDRFVGADFAAKHRQKEGSSMAPPEISSGESRRADKSGAPARTSRRVNR